MIVESIFKVYSTIENWGKNQFSIQKTSKKFNERLIHGRSVFKPYRTSHIVLEYNNENMRFIRIFLANQIAYIFRSIEKVLCPNNSSKPFITKFFLHKIEFIKAAFEKYNTYLFRFIIFYSFFTYL